MKKMLRRLPIVLCTVGLLFCTSAAFAELKEVGVLASYQGDLLLKHKGFWAEPPQKGMTLYHGDKILTRQGTCRVRFADGSLLDISPHSSVRLAETYIKHGLKLTRQRDVRLFVGKARYVSRAPDSLRTQLVAPTAVAALRGTDVTFGTDGIMATINMIEGESDISGDITQVDKVPESRAAQARRSREYRASETAGKVRKAYLDAVSSLLNSGRGGDRSVMLAAADPVLILQIVAQTGGDAQVAQAHKVLLLAALYVVADMNALIEENQALLENPDPRTAARAKETLEEAREEKEKAVGTLDQAKETVRQINGIIGEALSEDPQRAERAMQDLEPVLARLMAEQKTANQVALGKKLIVDIHTAGLDEALSRYEEREIERQAGELAEARAQRFMEGFPVGRWTERLVERVREEGGIPEDGLDETIEELEEEVGIPPAVVTRFPDLFDVEIPEPELDNDRDGDGTPDDRDVDPLDPRVTIDKGGYAN